MDLRLVERLATRVLGELRTAWEPIADLDCGLARVETTALFATIAAPEELVVHAELAVVVPGLEPTTMSLVVPNGALDPLRARLQTVRAADDYTTTSADAAWSARLRERMLDAPVELSVELGRARLRLSELLELAVGDLVPLDVGRDGPVVVRVEGTRHCHGTPGVQGGHNAVRIAGLL